MEDKQEATLGLVQILVIQQWSYSPQSQNLSIDEPVILE